ncbi:MAG: hypothetical protein JWO90_1509 [Solirubrobacterales bacterium]|nr:hypothetical protein [Solirubrobacterales bacterium]
MPSRTSSKLSSEPLIATTTRWMPSSATTRARRGLALRSAVPSGSKRPRAGAQRIRGEGAAHEAAGHHAPEHDGEHAADPQPEDLRPRERHGVHRAVREPERERQPAGSDEQRRDLVDGRAPQRDRVAVVEARDPPHDDGDERCQQRGSAQARAGDDEEQEERRERVSARERSPVQRARSRMSSASGRVRPSARACAAAPVLTRRSSAGVTTGVAGRAGRTMSSTLQGSRRVDGRRRSTRHAAARGGR